MQDCKMLKDGSWSVGGTVFVGFEKDEIKTFPKKDAKEMKGLGYLEYHEIELTEDEKSEIEDAEKTKEYIKGFEKHCVDCLNNHELSSIDIDKILTEVTTQEVSSEIQGLIDPFVKKLTEKKSKILVIEQRETDLNTGYEDLKKDRELFEAQKVEFKKSKTKAKK